MNTDAINLATNCVCQCITKMKNMFSFHKKMFLQLVLLSKNKNASGKYQT